jgi:hypothetical protein
LSLDSASLLGPSKPVLGGAAGMTVDLRRVESVDAAPAGGVLGDEGDALSTSEAVDAVSAGKEGGALGTLDEA